MLSVDSFFARESHPATREKAALHRTIPAKQDKSGKTRLSENRRQNVSILTCEMIHSKQHNQGRGMIPVRQDRLIVHARLGYLIGG